MIQKRETLDKQKTEKESLDNDFRESVWSKIFKKYEGSFKEAFTGTLHKEPFKNKITQEFNSNTSSIIGLEKLQKSAEIIVGKADVDIAKLIQ